jgi:glycosyltransferase involved in cell wall biosynthesis
MFCPVSRHSAIGHVGFLVAGALRDLGHEVVIISTEDREVALTEMSRDLGFVEHWRHEPAVLAVLETADVIVHHVGDNYSFHAGSVAWLDRVGGIVCLHDVFLGGLFITWSDDGNQDEADRVLREWYGRSLTWLYSLAADREHISGTWPDVTFTEWIASKADAIVVHSDYALEPLLSSNGGSVHVVPLAWDLRLPVSRQRAREHSEQVSILTFGAINHNKVADLVIRAIAADDALRSAGSYRLVGGVEPGVAGELTSLATELGVTISLTGPVSDEELAHELADADIVCCLRIPALESASASAIESLRAGKATIVANHGFYSGLPDDAVVKIDPLNAAAELSRELARLATDPGLRARLGKRGQEYARETFRADAYAKALLAIGRDVDGYRAQVEIERSFGAIYASWGADATDLGPVIELSRFFGDAKPAE